METLTGVVPDLLLQAIIKESPSAVASALAMGCNPNAILLYSQGTLHIVAELPPGLNIVIAKMLFKAGANVEMVTESGGTPLCFAVQHRQLPLVRFLVEEANANANVRKKNGASILHLAAEFVTDRKLLKYLLKNTCSELISAPQTDGGYTPLHTAIYRRNHKFVQLLLEHGADIAAMCNTGSTPLQCAVNSSPNLRPILVEQPSVVETLMKHGSDPFAKNPATNNTALKLAIVYNYSDSFKIMVRWILEKEGPEKLVELMTRSTGPSMIEDALCLRRANIIKYLRKHGVNGTSPNSVLGLIRSGIHPSQRQILERGFVPKPDNPLKCIGAYFAHVCASCQIPRPPGESEFKRCGRCVSVWYCTRSCQRSHWKADGGHRQDCTEKKQVQSKSKKKNKPKPKK